MIENYRQHFQLASEYLDLDDKLAQNRIARQIPSHEFPAFLAELERQVKEKRKKIKELQKKEYMYMITFTVDPKKHPVIDDVKINQIEKFVEDTGKRPGLCITKYTYVREYHKSGNPHWHAAVITTKPLEKSKLKYYENKYGQIRIDKSKVVDSSRPYRQQDGDLLNYLIKDGTPKTVIDIN